MTTHTPFDIQPFDIQSEADITLHHALNVVLHHERMPDDPPPTLEDAIKGFRSIPAFVSHNAWKVIDASGEMIAMGSCGWENLDHNQHLAGVRIGVHPKNRRQGIGTRLLQKACEVAEASGRTLFMMDSTSRIPASEAFITQMGATLGITGHFNELKIQEMDQEQLAAWSQSTPEGFVLEFLAGPYPTEPEKREEFIRVWQLFNEVPFGDLQIEKMHFTSEQLQQMDDSMVARGQVRWAMWARDTASGEIAGYTDIIFPPSHPHIAYQGLTAVWEQYRGRGVGRWLKAAMLEKIRRERPVVTLVRTDNASSNAGMLKINTDLGFRLIRTDKAWQVPVATAKAWAQSKL
jgi:mycothiol synthase